MRNYEIKDWLHRVQSISTKSMLDVWGDGCGIKQLEEVQRASALDSANSAGSAWDFRDLLLRVFVFENLQIVTNSPKGHDDLTETKSQCHKGFRKKNIRKICLCIEKKNVLLRKFWKDGEKGVSDKDLCSLILCCITVIVWESKCHDTFQ